LKALLSARGGVLRKTHDLAVLMDLLTDAGETLPPSFESLDALTPFGALYRYEDYDSAVGFDRNHARDLLRALRSWCEQRIEAAPRG
jgi:HEPN domain-containing protein